MKTKYKTLLTVLGSSVVIFVLILVMFILFFNANKNIKEYHVDDSELYTYFGNQKIEYKSHITLTRDNSATELKIDGNNVSLGSEPLYYKDQDKLIVPNNLNAVFPLKQMKQKKVNYYSIIEKKDDNITLTRDDKKIDMAHSFLYDGNDLYVFLEDTTISVGEKKVEVPALSFCLCVYNDELYIYNYKENKIEYIDLKENSSEVYAKGRSYLIDINYDYVKFNDKSILLNKNIESLESLN